MYELELENSNGRPVRVESSVEGEEEDGNEEVTIILSSGSVVTSWSLGRGETFGRTGVRGGKEGGKCKREGRKFKGRMVEYIKE